MKTRLIIGCLALALVLVGCQKQTSTNTNSSSNSVNTSSGSSGGTGSTGGGTGSASGGTTGGGGDISCAPSTDGSGYAPYQFDIQMAGHQKFYPGLLSDSEANQWGLMNLNEGKIAGTTDIRFKVRFGIHPQPTAAIVGDEYCYGRATGQPADLFKYNKIKFKVYLRDVLEHKINKNLIVTDRYGSARTIGPIDAGTCSPVIDYGPFKRNSSINPDYKLVSYIVEIDDVRSDSACQACRDSSTCQNESLYCEADEIVREASCWGVRMYISTDVTKDFY